MPNWWVLIPVMIVALGLSLSAMIMGALYYIRKNKKEGVVLDGNESRCSKDDD